MFIIRGEFFTEKL